MKYDGSLHMLIEDPREPDLNALRWLRWLVLYGHLGDETAYGPPSGEYAGAANSGERE